MRWPGALHFTQNCLHSTLSSPLNGIYYKNAVVLYAVRILPSTH